MKNDTEYDKPYYADKIFCKDCNTEIPERFQYIKWEIPAQIGHDGLQPINHMITYYCPNCKRKKRMCFKVEKIKTESEDSAKNE